MEERILDDEEMRRITLRETEDGETDALEGDEEYDDDLVGLTPSQLEEELERRKRAAEEAHAESVALTEEGEKRLSAKDYAGAETVFAQALVYEQENGRALQGVWEARTHGFTDAETFYSEEVREDLFAREDARTLVLGKMKQKLESERAAYAEEEEAIAPEVEGAQEEKRQAFRLNRNYYRVRFLALLAAFVASAIGCAVAFSFLYTTTSPAPVIAGAVLGGIAFAMLCALAVYGRKLLVAQRLCNANEKLSSTEKGARLVYLRGRISALDEVLAEKEGE